MRNLLFYLKTTDKKHPTLNQNVILNLFQNLPNDKHNIECELKFYISLKNNKLSLYCSMVFLSFGRY